MDAPGRLFISTSTTSLVSFCSSLWVWVSVLSNCLYFSFQHKLTARYTPDFHPSALHAAEAVRMNLNVWTSDCWRACWKVLKAWTPSKELTGAYNRARTANALPGEIELGGRWDREALFGPVSPPYRWDSSESAAQTSVQMDQGRSPRTLTGLGMRLARHGLNAKCGGNGNDGRGGGSGAAVRFDSL